MRKRKKNAAAMALAKRSATKRYKTMTDAERSEQGRRAAASRRDRQPKGPWYGLVALPADYVWHGAAHAAKVLDEAHADSANVVFWSRNRAEVVSRSQEDDLCDRTTLIVEQDWDPHAFRIIREYRPDTERQLRALRTVLDSEGGQS
ncbi:MAG: hypothetical protein ABSB88_08010 [Bryobacteraceae bacterium]|jgi:hypothetical protein